MGSTQERNADVAQARAFVVALNDLVDRCTVKIEDAQARSVALRTGGKVDSAKNLAADGIALRNELYEIHRQLDRLHDAFPELLQNQQ